MPTWTTEQKEAIEKYGSNIIVSAGAGSGKTAVLSERVIYKLTHGIHIQELLILTFTRAAAEEMKDRIRKKMKKDPALKREVDALESSYITTFDSFALSVVKKYHYLLNIPKDISISDESVVKIQKQRFLDETFEEFYRAKDEEFSKLIKKLCVKNDSSLRQNIQNLADKIENFIDRDKYLFDIKLNFFDKSFLDKILEEYNDTIREKKGNVSKELENISHYFDEKQMEKLQNLILPIINTTNLDEFSKCTKFRFPPLPTDLEEAKIAKKHLKEALDELLEYTKFGNEQEIFDTILETKEYCSAVARIIESYYKKLDLYKKENNIYTFQDIAMTAIHILKENEFARLELKNNFKEIMIDEYQDTNDIQETFIGLISSDNVYMVGDIKQSIYRFRGSNPSIFKDKYDAYSLSHGGYKIDLTKNFRSREEVLNNINRLFDLLMDNQLGGAEYYESHEMIYGNHDYDIKRIPNFDYNFEVLKYQNKTAEFSNSEVEIFTIATDIKNKIENKLEVYDKETSSMRLATYSDFVIILDRSKYFEEFKKIFEFLDIPLTILKDGKLNASNDLLIIKNIIDFIIRIKNNDYSINFTYDFLSIGRSFLYEYDDEYLFECITENKIKSSQLYKDFASILNYNSLSSSVLLEQVLSITDFYNKINKIGDYENINVRIAKIHEIASNLNEVGLSIKDFRDYLEEIVSKDYDIKYTTWDSSADSVKILTIHKSKGLEYPVCYFADLDHGFNKAEIKEKILCDHNYGLMVSLEDEEKESVIENLYVNAYKREELSEKIRLFYVALTRAREKMIIVIPDKENIKLEKNANGTIEYFRRLKFSKLSDFIYSVEPYLTKYFTYIDMEKINLTKNYLYKKTLNQIIDCNNDTNFTVEEINIPIESLEETHFSKNTYELINFEQKKNMDFGTKVHEILEYVDFKNYDENLIKDQYIRAKVTKFLNNSILKDISNATIYKEYEFIYEDEEKRYNGVIDLMLEYDNRIDIIDYKLKNTVDENYVKQLNGYKEYIERMSSKPVRTYLYSIIDELITEIKD